MRQKGCTLPIAGLEVEKSASKDVILSSSAKGVTTKITPQAVPFQVVTKDGLILEEVSALSLSLSH